MKRFVLAALLLAFPALAQVANVFTPTAQNTITATSSSSNIAFPDPNAPGILLTNTGPVVAYVRLGNSSVVAAATDKPINAGQYLWFASSGNTNIASITSGGGTSILVQSGTGTPNISYNASTAGSGYATTPASQAAGTVTTGGTFQTVLAANSDRTSCLLQNTSAHTGYVYWYSGTPSLTNSLQLAAGALFLCQNPAGAPIKTAIQYTTGTTADPYNVSENQ